MTEANLEGVGTDGSKLG